MDFLRSSISQPGMDTTTVVSELDVPGDITSGMFTGRILRAMHTLNLQHSEERLRHRIIETDTGPPDRLDDLQRFERVSELLGRVVTSAIRMNGLSLSVQ